MQVQVRDLQQGKILNRSRQPRQGYMVMANFDATCIAPGPAEHEHQPQAVPDNGTQ